MDNDNMPEHAYDRPDYHGTPWPGSIEARSYLYNPDHPDDYDPEPEDATDA